MTRKCQVGDLLIDRKQRIAGGDSEVFNVLTPSYLRKHGTRRREGLGLGILS